MKAVFLILILFASTLSFSQFSLERRAQTDPEKRVKEYTAGAFFTAFNDGTLSGFEGGIQVGKHAFNAGVGVDFFASQGNALKNWGLNFDYNYYPNGYTRRFDLFFDLNLVLSFPYYKYTTYDANFNYLGTYQSIEFTQDMHAGFGFNFNVSQKLYFKLGNGLGMSFYHFDFYDSFLGYNLFASFGHRF